MDRVTGIGGVFFRAKDPEGLPAWYEKMLGVTPVPADYTSLPWEQEEGRQFSPLFQSIPILSAIHSKPG
jgi:glyoxylase I family protein